MSALPLVLAAPAALAGLIALPVLWWLLRVSPPRPRQVTFPPLALLARHRRPEETPARLPWWLAALRLLLAALVILAFAGPAWRPAAAWLAGGNAPLWLIVDNGFAAAPDWANRLKTAAAILDEAGAAGRPVVLLATADGGNAAIAAQSADDVRRRLAALSPRAYFPARNEILPPLAALAARTPPGDVVVIAASGDDGSLPQWAGRLENIAGDAAITVAGDSAPPPAALAALAQDATGASATVRRPDTDTGIAGTVRLLDRRGRTIDERPFAFAAGAAATTARFELPLDIRNQVARADIAGLASAAAVHLVDDRWRRQAVGIVSAGAFDKAQPLLSPDYFLERALAPFADLKTPRSPATAEAVAGFIDDGATAIILADVGRLDAATAAALRQFMEKGGVLIRFAGPRLAASGDPLVPVPLREGDRVLGGALSWTEPRHLAAFAEDGPFADLKAPDDVTVSREVLAEPSAALDAHSWARLSDGTPLVTARAVGDGHLVLFHVTADSTWSNLPISGAFVEMLRRTIALGRNAGGGRSATAGDAQLPPYLILDGWGRPGPAPAAARGLLVRDLGALAPSRANPAGLYGSADGYRALNLMTPQTPYVRTDPAAFGPRARRVGLAGDTGIDLAPWLLLAAFGLLIADGLVMLRLGARTGLRRPGAALALALALLPCLGPPAARADDASDRTIIAALARTRLAYVETGERAIDATSRAGLSALSLYLASRTSLEPGEPVAVDPARDELSVYPLIYWPVDAAAPLPGRDTMTRIERFMKSGGTVLFDSRDALAADPATGASPARARLADMLAGIDVPPLEPVPADHVLTKAFYLLTDFPGRYDGAPLWVEASAPAGDDSRPVRRGDGVSPILITGNDLAGAWAADAAGSFLHPLVPGTPMQREHAFRAGVNIVMYVLTGNYKADQVHVPALLERLGRR